uniref:Dechloroacutumine halogenase n=1 Tax=Menispermum canadense TaxID=49681 RepID=A0A6M3RHU8_9MAGN|nr:dechloroacutumine halogenase [Menispermum canadense]
MEVEKVLQPISKSGESGYDHFMPEDFIRPEDEQPELTTFKGPTPDIPVIDLSEPDEEKLVRALVSASEEWGIFQVVNHGIPTDVIDKFMRVGREFFELPQEEKMAYARPPGATSLEGYETRFERDYVGKKAWADLLFHNVWPPSIVNYSFWPKNPPSYREATEEYAKHIPIVADKLFKILSLGLGLEGNTIKEGLGGEKMEFLMKINYYPPCPRPDLALGVVPHTGYPAMTILIPTDVPGLQVFKDDLWYDAKYIPYALVVNIADQIEILSNGKYKSVLHRAKVNKEKVRMSWPIFCTPPADMVIGPIPELINEENPSRYKYIEYKDYVQLKLKNKSAAFEGPNVAKVTSK